MFRGKGSLTGPSELGGAWAEVVGVFAGAWDAVELPLVVVLVPIVEVFGGAWVCGA